MDIHSNFAIETLLNHRSIRNFRSDKLSQKQITTLVKSAQQASSSSFYQAYSILSITDPVIKKELRNISGQPYVEQNGHLFVFCADLHRLSLLVKDHELQITKENLTNTEHFIVAVVDAALAAQNVAIAAESMGLGICYIGSLRNNIKKVDKLLKLPNLVIPIFGMALGYPLHQPEHKPRLPIDAVHFENEYKADNDVLALLDKYDTELKDYYNNRSENRKVETWSHQITSKFRTPIRMDVNEFVRNKGLNKN